MLRTKSGLPKHCTWAYDRHGKRRVRLNRKGFSTYLTDTPWSETFMRQYAAALDGQKVMADSIGIDRTRPNTLGALIKAYLDTPKFKSRAPETRRTQRNILENFAEDHGDKLIYQDRNGRRILLLRPEHLQAIVNNMADRPFAQRNFLNTVRVMFNWAKIEGRIPSDPSADVTRDKVKTAGYATWLETDIGRFEAAHPVGTKARLAFALLLYTGQRRGDVVKLGRQNIDTGWLIIDQGKTAGGEEAHVEIPVHPKLREIIDATPTVGVKNFLVTHWGKPYTAPGFGNWFRELCDAAGCHGLSAHRRLAEIGCSALQIAAITGHGTLKEVSRYTKAADRKRMASEAITKLNEHGW